MPEIKSSNRNMEKLRIMVVDDEHDTCEFITRFLSREGYEAVVVGNAEEAISKFKLYKPQIILLDIRLPGMDGIECLKRIRELDKKVCVIIVTVVSDEETSQKAQALGAYDYITKPIDLDYLRRCIFLKSIFLSIQA